MIFDVVKVFAPAAFSFFVGIALSPIIAHYLYKHKLWKNKTGAEKTGRGKVAIQSEIRKEKEAGTPLMGGVVIWASVLITSFVVFILSVLFSDSVTEKLNFISRGQTWLPLFTLIVGSIVGLADDFLVIYGRRGYVAGGLPIPAKIGVILGIGFIGALWFYYKLGISAVSVPFLGEFELGLLFIPFFMIVMLALFSGGAIDRIDGLSGGIMATIFSAYSGIAFFQNQIDIAAFCAVVAGAILAFLWFNIPPARFYMSETGILGLTTSLSIVAFLTDSVLVLPIIAFPLFLASGYIIIQTLSKNLRAGEKIFSVTPVRRNFEELGWPSYKITMRVWVISVITAIIGMIIALAG
ncbi:MAG: hypothetical protein AAB355_02835 [Patescibacteria group bacterium]